MKNFEFIKNHFDIPDIQYLAQDTCLTNKKYDDMYMFITKILLTFVQPGYCYAINGAVEEVLFDYGDMIYSWWLGDEYDGWYERRNNAQDNYS